MTQRIFLLRVWVLQSFDEVNDEVGFVVAARIFRIHERARFNQLAMLYNFIISVNDALGK